MKKIFILTLILALVFPVTAGAQTVRNKKIAQMQHKIDSLQKAYDELYEEYQNLLEESSASDFDDILVDNELSPLLELPDSDQIDSMLNIYYLQKQTDISRFDIESLETDSLTSTIPDAVYVERLKKMNSFIPVQFNKVVKNSIIRYTERIPSVTSRILGLSAYYLPIFEGIMDEYNLPKELKAMAVIESALNPRAVSRAHAKGMWQFMYNTAKLYGLEMTSYVDERYDPIASCRAAAQYLKDSYMVFGDWSLAIASYNCGTGNVSKAIRRSGGKTDFWEIYPYLPRETRGYIPAFIAALYVLNYYKEHNITPAPISLPAHVDTFHVDKMLHFQQISENIGISVEQLRDLNPQYLHDIIPGTEHQYVLNLPHTYTLSYVDLQDSIYRYKDTVFFNETKIKQIKENGGDGQRIIHKVKSGETLGSIARKYHTTVSRIKQWNGLRSDMLRVGQRLSIYGSSSSVANSSSGSGTKAKSGSSSSSGNSSGQSSFYTVRKGDTLSKIASKTGVSLSKLYSLNGMNSRSVIYPGMKIRIKAAK